eukprot:m.46926 g.46926  ORF g.46926 m.46926 type:complete len:62 (-) comp10428_c0_seq1:265-450(-)
MALIISRQCSIQFGGISSTRDQRQTLCFSRHTGIVKFESAWAVATITYAQMLRLQTTSKSS